MFLLAFLALLPRFLLGFMVVHRVWRSMDRKDLLLKVFLAGPAGFGLSSLASFLWIWAKLDLHTYAVLETTAALMLLILALWMRRSAIIEFLRTLRPSYNKHLAFWLVVLFMGLLVYSGEFWINSLQNPHGRWDAWSNWVVVARFVFRGGEHWTGTFLRAPDHPDYPFMLAMSNAVTWELLPRETTRGPIVLAFFFTVCVAGLLFSLLYKLRDFAQAALGAVVFMSMPFVAYHGMALYADLPEAYYFLASAGLIPIFLSGRDKEVPILAGFMTGLAAWTKNEGLTFVLVSGLAWTLIWYRFGEKSALRCFLAGLAFPAIVVLLFKVFLAPQNDLFVDRQTAFTLLLDVDRFQFILSRSALGFWNVGDGLINFVAILAVYALLTGKTRYSIQGMALVLLVVLAQLAFYFLAYMISPHDLDWHVRTSLSRLYLHVLPLMLLCLFMQLKTPGELSAESGT